MSKYLLTGIVLVFITQCAFCQETERNYRVVSETTSCDQLPTAFTNKQEALELITGANHRIEQNFKIRRPKGLKAGEYYSCDNKVGFLVIWIDDQYNIYQAVPLNEWENLISSNDPEGVLMSRIRPKYVKL